MTKEEMIKLLLEIKKIAKVTILNQKGSNKNDPIRT